MKNTNIQWCDSTINPVMGCDGCPLFPKPATVRNSVSEWLISQGNDKSTSEGLVNEYLRGMTLSEIYHRRNELSGSIAAAMDSDATPVRRGFESELARQFSKPVSCYAAILHLVRGRNPSNPKKWIHPGYAPVFEEPTLFPGRTAAAAKWSDLSGQTRTGSPWKDGLPRMIFVSDMGDSLSAGVAFEYLLREVIHIADSHDGSKHLWLWLSKRPARMAKFDRWLEARGIRWPENLIPMTSVIDRKMMRGVESLKTIRSSIKGLSVEPLLEDVDLDLEGIDWVIAGGESGSGARPFHLEWAESLIRQCEDSKTAFFMKQMGASPFRDGKPVTLRDSHGGNWDEWPENLRIRKFPRGFRRVAEEQQLMSFTLIA